MARLFLSHASADKPAVRRIAKTLRDAGHDPWLDEEQIDIGDSIPASIERGLREADFVIVCLSAAAAKRGWVQAEHDATLMQQLEERRARILPVRLEKVDPPYLLRAIAYADLFPDDDAFARGISRLLRAIEKHSKSAALPAFAPNATAPATPAPAAAPVHATPAFRGTPPVQTPDQTPALPAPVFEPSPAGTVDVFLSFAPADVSFAKALETQLAVLTRQSLIRLLHRGQIGPGQPREALLAAQLDAARIIVVLVSPAYFASDDCFKGEMERALERHRKGETRVIPILVRPIEGWKQTPLGSLQSLPRIGAPVSQWAHADQAWADIATELRKVVLLLLGLPLPAS